MTTLREYLPLLVGRKIEMYMIRDDESKIPPHQYELFLDDNCVIVLNDGCMVLGMTERKMVLLRKKEADIENKISILQDELRDIKNQINIEASKNG